MNKVLNIALIGVLGICNLASAEESAETPESNTESVVDQHSGWFFSVGTASLDSQVASNEFIDDGAVYLNVGWEGNKDSFAYGVGISGLLLSDNAGFSQYVEDIFGNTSNASSSAEAFGAFGELGYNHKFESGKQAFEIMGGFELLTAERSIGNCSNCYSESIDLSSGVYVKPRFRFYSDSGFVFSLSYRKYLTGDLENAFSLDFSWTH